MTKHPIAVAVAVAAGSLLLVPGLAAAQSVGTPPPEAKAEVGAPKAAVDAPKIEEKLDGTTATVAAGGMFSSGNSRQVAMTANGAFETRFTGNAVGASILGNYGRSAPPGDSEKTTTQNVQGRLRYDRYVVQQASFFLINTGRHDRFQGIDFRYNLDPGFKYLVWQESAGAAWGEGGYDFQYDIRRDSARQITDKTTGAVIQVLDKTAVDHSARLFAGARYAFNKEVTINGGVEYLQSFVDSNRFRLNFDVVFAAKIGGGLSAGLGFSGRYDHAPLPGKADFDSATTINLIYAFSNIVEPAAPPSCPCPAPPPPAPPPAGPSSGPESTSLTTPATPAAPAPISTGSPTQPAAQPRSVGEAPAAAPRSAPAAP